MPFSAHSLASVSIISGVGAAVGGRSGLSAGRLALRTIVSKSGPRVMVSVCAPSGEWGFLLVDYAAVAYRGDLRRRNGAADAEAVP